MKFEAILNGKSTKRDIPINYDQLPFGQFIEVAKAGEDLNKILSVFTGIPSDIINKAKIRNLDTILHLLSFLKRECETRIPERLGMYALPKDLGFESIAQYEDMKAAVKETVELDKIDQLAKYTYYCAIYACSQLSRERCDELAKQFPNDGIEYGTYHYRKAEAIEKEFLNYPTPEVLGVGHFTLLKLTGLSLGIDPTYRKPITQTKRLRLALKRLGMRLGSWEYLTTWVKRRVLKKVNS